ncbi:MAG: galactokinase family protein [Actinomycetaceae bacterium]|nr:galactokinase family protein [Actinomycetaceae bacterium]MDO5746986.1 galactokinase family protein [Actinomycetaceae bacterium]
MPHTDPLRNTTSSSEKKTTHHTTLCSFLDVLSTPVEETSWFVPGRLEVFGKHTDYGGGRSLLGAVDRGISFYARTNDSDLIRLRSTAFPNDELTWKLSQDITAGAASWATHAASAITRLNRNFPGQLRGTDIRVDSTLPLASGMSSSSAMVVGIARCLIDISGIGALPDFRANITSFESFAGYMSCMENGLTFGTLRGHGGVGTFGGSEDHTAMLCCRADALSQYSFAPVVHHETVTTDPSMQFVIAVSGVLAEKTGAALQAYNRLSLTVSQLLTQWNTHTGRSDTTLMQALNSTEKALATLQKIAGEEGYPRQRLEQFVKESEHIVPAACQAFATHDYTALGHLASSSQHLSLEYLGNQIPHTHALTLMARAAGAVASSAFGAGFGGAVWALVPRSDANDFTLHWQRAYLQKYPELTKRASFFPVHLSGRATRTATP